MADEQNQNTEASLDPTASNEAPPTTTSPPPPTRQPPPIPHASSNVPAVSTPPAIQPPQKPSANHIAGAPARQYLNEFVTPYLLEGMKAIARDQPPNPLQMLGQYLLEKSAQLESSANEKTVTLGAANHHTIDLPMTIAPEHSPNPTAEVDGDSKMSDASML